MLLADSSNRGWQHRWSSVELEPLLCLQWDAGKYTVSSQVFFRTIHLALSILYSINSNITFIWVPGHVDFSEHDNVDTAAKLPTSFTTISEKLLRACAFITSLINMARIYEDSVNFTNISIFQNNAIKFPSRETRFLYL